MKYDVSVLVPVYNGEQYIERCVRSLFEQTHSGIQFVFVDDCSPDSSIQILHTVLLDYPERKKDVIVITHEKNKGLAGARNTGIENAAGEYIIHIDSDDYVELSMVEEMFLVAKNKDADIVVADFYLQWEKTSKYVHLDIYGTKEEYVKKLLDASALPAVWNKMFRKEIYTKNQIKAIEGINFGEDITVTPKLVYFSEKIIKLDKAFLHYVQYNNNSYSKEVTDKNINDILFTLDHLEVFFSNVPNSERFLNALENGRLQKKLEFIKNIDGKRLNKILKIYAGSKSKIDGNRFSLFDRLLLNLSKTNVPLLRVFIYGYKKVFTTAQFLKGR